MANKTVVNKAIKALARMERQTASLQNLVKALLTEPKKPGRKPKAEKAPKVKAKRGRKPGKAKKANVIKMKKPKVTVIKAENAPKRKYTRRALPATPAILVDTETVKDLVANPAPVETPSQESAPVAQAELAAAA